MLYFITNFFMLQEVFNFIFSFIFPAIHSMFLIFPDCKLTVF
ncbi:hypothetical protein DORFOR_01687 [Dorea formicigenerans ATCC 27755]|uniref:Uncharacterized protein n=1 Tax=Dorea formicigenerans ATCC 27755 TaxID=411461 RepID=B0G5Z5_9FIRM|nr:hypothetical protein DORFOR_01687 [Dorea formicigenerans ATCC 27755]